MRMLTKMGILIFIISLPVLYLIAMNFQGGFTVSGLQMIIPSHNTMYTLFSLTNASAVGFSYYTNATAINFLLLNQSGFSSIAAQVNSSQTINGSRLEGRGAIELSSNSIFAIFPYQQGGVNQTGTYFYNSSPFLPAGSYYAIFENPSPSDVKVYYSLSLKPQSEMSSTIFSSGAFLGTALFFGGVVIILYSVLAKPKKEEQTTAMEEYVEKLYAKQGRHRGHASRGKRRKARK
jgi:hypothetical protein